MISSACGCQCSCHVAELSPEWPGSCIACCDPELSIEYVCKCTDMILRDHIHRLLTAMSLADAELAGMWSFNDQSRENLAYTYPVRASEILRKASSETPY